MSCVKVRAPDIFHCSGPIIADNQKSVAISLEMSIIDYDLQSLINLKNTTSCTLSLSFEVKTKMAVQCDAVSTALDSVDDTEYFSVFHEM